MLILYEDADLLVINKPAGMNTHAPSPYAGEGIYDWLRHREPRWANLSIIHRLDKETSGVMVFGKTPEANHSLTEQFAGRSVKKRYVLATDRRVRRQTIRAQSVLVRAGDRYLSRPVHSSGDMAETEFTILRTEDSLTIIEAVPRTGRTHQIRVHAAEHGFPILGDTLYGGARADRLWLHSEELEVVHPRSGQKLRFKAEADFHGDSRLKLREAIIEPNETNAYRLIHGSADKWPGWYVDRLGDYLLSQSETPLQPDQRERLAALLASTKARGAYHKLLVRSVRQSSATESSPQHIMGDTAPTIFTVRENGVSYRLSFEEGYSVGIFLDQRDNRRRFLVKHVAADFPLFESGAREVLNTFAYTCGFSVCAALAGAHTTSLDLSKKYLDWGKQNFALNDLDPTAHDFIFGDVFDWLRRLAKKKRAFDSIILDPPTFSQSKSSGVFRVEKDYGLLVQLALPLLRPAGVFLASTNAAKWRHEEFVNCVESAFAKAKRKILQKHFVPQPPDLPVSREEPAYLKTLWLRAE